MAIRLRNIKNTWIALCAAESKEMAGDIYLDDSQDRALRIKFKKDYSDEGIDIFEHHRDFGMERLMKNQKNETTYPGNKLMQADFKIKELKAENLELKKHYKVALKKIKELLNKE